MANRLGRRAAVALAASVVVFGADTPALGALPLIAGLGKQIVQNLLIDGIKSQLIGSLANSGCKGAALASVLAGSPGRTLGGMVGGGLLSGGLPGAGMLPGGLPLVSGPPLAGALPPGTAAAAGLADAAALGVARGGAGAPAPMPSVGIDPRTIGTMGTMDMSRLMATMQQRAGAQMAGLPPVSPEQAAQMQSAMAAMQQAMAQPLSPAESKAVFDELGTLGVMTPAMQSEVGDCLALAGPAATPQLGMAAAMMKQMVLPKLREARQQMAELSPEQREQMASEIAQAMNDASPEDRKAFADGFGVGFFPPEVVELLRAKLR
ncbi:MAG: hypothetical protein HS128_07850 [Ideonella sp.]|nr:hypothetical protein [Ideonella sp.]MCC7458247.1 hypothetical protein [Nitrospira sp.]